LVELVWQAIPTSIRGPSLFNIEVSRTQHEVL
jgi:hypothetical protein